MVELNREKLREELIEVYEGYLKNKYNPVIVKEATRISVVYDNAAELLDRVLEKAINLLPFILQKKRIDDKKVREILKELKSKSYNV